MFRVEGLLFKASGLGVCDRAQSLPGRASGRFGGGWFGVMVRFCGTSCSGYCRYCP